MMKTLFIEKFSYIQVKTFSINEYFILLVEERKAAEQTQLWIIWGEQKNGK